MKLSQLASKPQLVELVIDDPAIVEKYGEELQFFVHDRLPIDTYTKFATVDSNNAGQLYTLVKDLILDESGKPVIHGDYTLPVDIMSAAIMKVTETLGK